MTMEHQDVRQHGDVTGALITAHVVTPVITSPWRINLAALLTWAVCDARPVSPELLIVDVPGLHLFWRDDDGMPLWAATDIYPVDDAFESREYAHKRFRDDRADFARSMKISLVAGQHKDRRVPLRVVQCDTWVAAALTDDITAMREQLARVRSLGARGASGYGRVASWTVEEFDCDEAFILARRAVPVHSGLIDTETANLPHIAWTPPYWHPPLWKPGREGQPCF